MTMTQTDPDIRELTAADLITHTNALCDILIDSVAAGAAISFMAPLARSEAQSFWQKDVAPAVEHGTTTLFGAFVEGALMGTVQLVTGLPPNQPYRAEIAKMIVHPKARRRGLARALMERACDTAREAGKTLITLDTRPGDASEQLYLSLGFIEAGVIPNFALDPDGKAMHATAYMYKPL